MSKIRLNHFQLTTVSQLVERPYLTMVTRIDVIIEPSENIDLSEESG